MGIDNIDDLKNNERPEHAHEEVVPEDQVQERDSHAVDFNEELDEVEEEE